MKSLHLRVHVDAQGQVTLPLPADFANQDVDLVVVFSPVTMTATGTDAVTDSDWPPGFYEATAGAWQGEALVRDSEGNYEVRDPLE